MKRFILTATLAALAATSPLRLMAYPETPENTYLTLRKQMGQAQKVKEQSSDSVANKEIEEAEEVEPQEKKKRNKKEKSKDSNRVAFGDAIGSWLTKIFTEEGLDE